MIGADERRFHVLQNANLTEAESGDAVNYRLGDVLPIHQYAKGFRRGGRRTLSGSGKLPDELAAWFQVFYAKSLQLAAGNLEGITRFRKTAAGAHGLGGHHAEVHASDVEDQRAALQRRAAAECQTGRRNCAATRALDPGGELGATD